MARGRSTCGGPRGKSDNLKVDALPFAVRYIRISVGRLTLSRPSGPTGAQWHRLGPLAPFKAPGGGKGERGTRAATQPSIVRLLRRLTLFPVSCPSPRQPTPSPHPSSPLPSPPRQRRRSRRRRSRTRIFTHTRLVNRPHLHNYEIDGRSLSVSAAPALLTPPHLVISLSLSRAQRVSGRLPPRCLAHDCLIAFTAFLSCFDFPASRISLAHSIIRS
jgi:hypothetical protein